MSNNWVVENLQNALATWNDKLSEIWRLLTESPDTFKGGVIWNVMVNINDALKAIGYALLVLFFLVGIMRQFHSFAEVKRPEQIFKLFLRFVLAKAAVTWGLELMMAMFKIAQGIIGKIMEASGIGGGGGAYLPSDMIDTIENCSFWESIPLWAVTLIGSLLVTVLSFIMILTVYGRFSVYISMPPLHRFRFRPLREKKRQASVNRLSNPLRQYVWRERSSCWRVSSTRFLHLRRLRSM